MNARPEATVGVDPSALALVRIADALGAAEYGGELSRSERAVLQSARALPPPDGAELDRVIAGIGRGDDPLGALFCEVRSATRRRTAGAFYTPAEIIRPMVSWALSSEPARVVDAGAGTGRFTAEMVRRDPELPIIAIEVDPVASLLCRAHLAVIGGVARVVNDDYTRIELDRVKGPTAFIGNPPYVRHHDLDPLMKEWARVASTRLGRRCSGLAGLHVYFFLATSLFASRGDVGCFVTSAEWLDVGYGAFLRWLLL